MPESNASEALNSQSHSFLQLEKEITEVVGSFRSLIKYQDSFKEGKSLNKNGFKPSSAIPELESNVTLEKVLEYTV